MLLLIKTISFVEEQERPFEIL